VGRTKTALETLAEPTYVEPMDPPANASRTQVQIWEKQVDEHVKRVTMLAKNLKLAYSLIYGQCTNALQAKLESRPNHVAIEGAADSIGYGECEDGHVPVPVATVQPAHTVTR
jgi:hypothetical protein